MRLYLDDDSAWPVLLRLLRRAGHQVTVPSDVGMSGRDDSLHLAFAVEQNLVFLSHNHDDFLNLHNLVAKVGGHHPGIFIVRRDNDPKRDLSPRGIVTAIRNLVTAGVPLPDSFCILNHWR
jgi:predicted nuclease of predicted toxin-antitoxin system